MRARRAGLRSQPAKKPRADRHALGLVIKVGGSLMGSRVLPRIVTRIAWLARRRRLVVVPGGGRFADLVRNAQARFGLDDETTHRMALRGMDQYGLILAALAPRGRAVRDLNAARTAAAAGRMPVLLAACTLDDDGELERSSRLSSDAIAAAVARRLGARHIVMLKSCACPRDPIRRRAALRALARRGVVDPLFPALVPIGCEVRLINARSPAAWQLELARPERDPLR